MSCCTVTKGKEEMKGTFKLTSGWFFKLISEMLKLNEDNLCFHPLLDCNLFRLIYILQHNYVISHTTIDLISSNCSVGTDDKTDSPWVALQIKFILF